MIPYVHQDISQAAIDVAVETISIAIYSILQQKQYGTVVLILKKALAS